MSTFTSHQDEQQKQQQQQQIYKRDRYLIEFKGTQPNFRIDEFKDCLAYSVNKYSNKSNISTISDYTYGNDIIFEEIIPDRTSNSSPICSYIELTAAAIPLSLCTESNTNGNTMDLIMKDVVQRSSLIRSIVDVWGDGKTIIEAAETSSVNVNTKKKDTIYPDQSWRVHFRRYGRQGKSGLSYDGKRILLDTFSKTFKSLQCRVDLSSPDHEFLYLEDWADYHNKVTIPTAKLKKLNKKQNATAIDVLGEDYEQSFQPSRVLFGRIIETGASISADYDIKTRPFIGTTTMDPIAAHITALAGRIGCNDIVLDPFCGTGGILISICALGATAVGSDIDDDCLGVTDRSTLAYKDISKNTKFLRLGGDSVKYDQSDKSIKDNFIEYKLQHKLLGLHAMDIVQWKQDYRKPLTDTDTVTDNIDDMYADGFDAIITDPPYGLREKAKGMSVVDDATATTASTTTATATADSTSDNDTDTVYINLLQVAYDRLKVNGRLVFWYPSDAFVSKETIIDRLLSVADKASITTDNSGDTNVTNRSDLHQRLQFQRCQPEEMNNNVWRWLCTFVKT